MVVDDKSNGNNEVDSIQSSLLMKCDTHNLIDIFVVKTRALARKKFHLKLMCLYVCLDPKECQGVTFSLTNRLIFEKYEAPKLNSSAVERVTNAYDTKDKVMLKLHQIRDVLTDLKNHLVSDQEQYLNAMHIKIDNLKKIMNIVKVLRDGAPIKGDVMATKITFKPNSKNFVGTVILNSESVDETRNITALSQHLKNVNENIKGLLAKQRYVIKRSLNESSHWFGKGLRVKKLFLKSAQHPFKGE